jgi:hypothetical protein
MSTTIVNSMVASRVARAEQDRITETSILRDMIGRDCIAQIPTMGLQQTGPMRPVSTKPMLLLDDQGRPYTMTSDSTLDTLSLIKDQVRKFVDFEKRYPDEILLSPFRYFTKGAGITHYLIPQFGLSIPLIFERAAYEAFNFEILVRGRAK